MRTIGTFAAKSAADQALAYEVSTMARGGWRDPRLGEQPLGEWFRGWIATRTDIAESTHALYEQVLATWIDAPIPVAATSGRPRAIHLGIRTLASLTPAVVREWNHAVTTESTRRVTERWERNGTHDTRVNAAIRAWAATSGAPLAPTSRIPGQPQTTRPVTRIGNEFWPPLLLGVVTPVHQRVPPVGVADVAGRTLRQVTVHVPHHLAHVRSVIVAEVGLVGAQQCDDTSTGLMAD